MQRISIHEYDKSLNYLVQRIDLVEISEKNRGLLGWFKDTLLLDGLSKPGLSAISVSFPFSLSELSYNTP